MSRCLQCQRLLFGRIDKKFCDDGCRNVFHNTRNSGLTSASRRINHHLRGNWTILNELTLHGESSIPSEELIRYGFAKQYVTSMEVKDGGDILYGLYDFIYTLDVDNVVHFRRDYDSNKPRE